jgi:hypothetical protein
MVTQKYTDLGFDITEFGAKSKVLRFEQKPIFVFNACTNLDAVFLAHICETYLKISEKRKTPVCIRVN